MRSSSIIEQGSLMIHKNYIQLDPTNRVVNELEYTSAAKPANPGPELTDVTDRQDGPFIGKIYDPDSDTFSDPPEEPEN